MGWWWVGDGLVGGWTKTKLMLISTQVEVGVDLGKKVKRDSTYYVDHILHIKYYFF